MKRRDLIRPDLNKQYGSLCNPSTAPATFLFGYELNKEVDKLTKADMLSSKVTSKRCSDHRAETYKVPFARGERERCRLNQNSSRSRQTKSYTSFLGIGRGHGWAPTSVKTSAHKEI